MQPLLNLAPEVYEAIIAAFALVSVIAVFALARKHQQAEKLKSTLKTVITEATKAVITGAMFGAIQVARAKRETSIVMQKSTEAMQEAAQRIEELETELAEAQADDEPQGDEYAGTARFPFGSPGPFAGNHDDLFSTLRSGGFSPTGRRLDPIEALLGSLGRNTGNGRGPSIQAFKITPDGLVPVNGPEDFGFERPTTNTRPDPSRRTPSITDILSLLATLPTPPRRRHPLEMPYGEELRKADLSGKPGEFLYDDHGPVAPGDAYADAADAARASVTEGAGLGEAAREPATHPTAEAEACDTQRAPAPLAGGDEPPANEPGARAVPRYGFDSQSPRAG